MKMIVMSVYFEWHRDFFIFGLGRNPGGGLPYETDGDARRLA